MWLPELGQGLGKSYKTEGKSLQDLMGGEKSQKNVKSNTGLGAHAKSKDGAVVAFKLFALFVFRVASCSVPGEAPPNHQ